MQVAKNTSVRVLEVSFIASSAGNMVLVLERSTVKGVLTAYQAPTPESDELANTSGVVFGTAWSQYPVTAGNSASIASVAAPRRRHQSGTSTCTLWVFPRGLKVVSDRSLVLHSTIGVGGTISFVVDR